MQFLDPVGGSPQSPLLATVAAALALLWPSPADGQCTGCPNPSFGSAARSYDVSAEPFGSRAAAADFNRDGNLDVAFTAMGGNVGVMLGNPRGMLGPPASYSASPSYVQELAAGDFNLDGVPDLVVSQSHIDPGFAILLGNGAGGFLPPSSVPTSLNINLVASGDFDGDGWPDVAASAPEFSGQVEFFLNDGGGGFLPPLFVVVGPGPSSLTVADFNADGRSDLAVTNSNDSVSVILGAAGPLAPPITYATGLYTFSAAAGDFNGDLLLDLAVSTSSGLVLLWGDGSGQFPSSSSFSVLGGRMVSGDFNGDGLPDLAIAAPYSFSRLLNNGGGFQITTKEVTYGPLTAADFNRDGITDLLSWTYGVFSLLLSGGSSVLEIPKSVKTLSAIGGFATADFNGDARPDLAVAGSPWLEIFLSTGAGEFLALPLVVSNDSGEALAADFTRDGKNDLAIANANGIAVRPGNGDGTFGAPVNYPTGSSSFHLASGDFNTDGAPDLVALNGSTSVFLFTSLPNGTFGAATQHPVGGSANSAAAADFNRDGRMDLATANSEGTLSLLLGNGFGGFFSLTTFPTGPLPTSLLAEDWNGDGSQDLLVVNGDFYARKISMHAGNGAGGFLPAVESPLEIGSVFAVAADFNGDGKLDLAVTRERGTTVFINDGTGSFGRPATYRSTISDYRIVTADFDLDGSPDIAVTGNSSYDFAVLLNTNCKPRILGISADVSSCAEPGTPLAPQPVVAVYDDGDNVVSCDTGAVNASLLSAGGAALGGTTTVLAVAGVAAFTNLSVNLPGKGYQLAFTHPVVGRAHSRRFSQGIQAVITGPLAGCFANSQSYSSSDVHDTYLWKLNGVPIGWLRAVTLGALAPGTHTLELAVTDDGCSATATLLLTVPSPSPPFLSAPSAVCPHVGGLTASVPDAGLGATYLWTIENGAITSGAGTRTITFRAGPFGQTILTATIRTGGCVTKGTRSVAINPSLSCPTPIGFFTVTPCRLFDSRTFPGPFGGPVLAAGAERVIPIAGPRCGIPANAKAVAMNVTVTQPTAPGHLTLYPGGTSLPSSSTINYRAGQTRANNAILPLGAAGDLAARCGQASGSVHWIVDMYGYFE